MEPATSTSSSSLPECYDNYILIDVGANLNHKKFTRDMESVIQRAKDAGVQKLIVPGSSTRSSKEALRLTKLNPGTIYSTAGVHPYEAKSWDDDQLKLLKEMLSNSECVAVGECGLDYTKDFSPQDVQRDVFEKQVALACELKKPLYLHEKGARDDLISILMKYQSSLPTLVLHSFVGTFDDAIAYLNLDTYISLTGYLCKDNSNNGIQKLLESGELNLSRILIESDSPFFYPNARSTKLSDSVKSNLKQKSSTFLQRYCTFQRNEPCCIPVIVEIIAGILQKPPEEIALATTFNALKIFGLS